MSSAQGITKCHFGIMKSDALSDYRLVCEFFKQRDMEVIEPKKMTTWKIEDATSTMLKSLPKDVLDKIPNLQKGVSYYFSI